MSINHSSSTNDSVSHQSTSLVDCTIIDYLQFALTITNIIFLIPLSGFVLRLGFQPWKQQRCGSSSAVTNLSDFVTYNLAVLELIGALGAAIAISARLIGDPVVTPW
ncbi:hypothetical protein KUCAC02_009698 [Chaenocephalus aceratus]|nr:hypothetical protein KUCAC02_009698 [Chaenocephalus aceratus]